MRIIDIFMKAASAVVFTLFATVAAPIKRAKALVTPVCNATNNAIGALSNLAVAVTDTLQTAIDAIRMLPNIIALIGAAIVGNGSIIQMKNVPILTLPMSETYLQLIPRAPRDLVLRAFREMVFYSEQEMFMSALLDRGIALLLDHAAMEFVRVTTVPQEGFGTIMQWLHVIRVLSRKLKLFFSLTVLPVVLELVAMPYQLPTILRGWAEGLRAIMQWLHFTLWVLAHVIVLLFDLDDTVSMIGTLMTSLFKFASEATLGTVNRVKRVNLAFKATLEGIKDRTFEFYRTTKARWEPKKDHNAAADADPMIYAPQGRTVQSKKLNRKSSLGSIKSEKDRELAKKRFAMKIRPLRGQSFSL